MAATEVSVPRGPIWAAQLFLFSLLIPFYFKVGTLVLMPHRVVILVLFIPFFLKLFVFRTAGPVLLPDVLLFLSAIWAGFALVANHPLVESIEPFGIHMLEFFGAYLLARVAIRNSQDFRRMVRLFYFLLLFLLPFAAIESFTHRAILIELLPGSTVRPVNAGVRFGLRRAQAIFAHPILFGVFASTGFGLFWYAMRPRALGVLGVPLSALTTIFSMSTGALISFVMQSVFIGWEIIMKVLKRRWRLFTILSIIGYFAVDFLSNRTPFHVLVTYASFSQGSAYNRILIWNFGTDNVWDHPIFGLGFNDWARPSWMSGSVDNYWLLLTMRYGLPAIIMILAALFLILRRVSKAELTDKEDQLCRAAYLVAFGGLFISGGTVHFWHAMMAFVMFIYGSGLWVISGGAVREDDSAPVEEEPEPRSRYTRQVAPGIPIGRARRPSRAAPTPASATRRSPPRRKAGPDRQP